MAVSYRPEFQITPALLTRVEAIAALRERIQDATVQVPWTASHSGAKLVLRPKQERLLQLLRVKGSLSPREIWDGLSVSKQGAADLLRPLIKAGLVKRVGTLKTGRYLLK